MNRSLFIQFGVAGVALGAALGAVVVSALVTEEAKSTLQETRTRISEAHTQVQSVEAAKAALPVLAEAEQVLTGRVVRPKDIVPFLESLERQGTAQGAKVEVLSVTGGDGAPRLTLSLKIAGTYDAVMRTVGRIEHRPEDIVLTSLTLDADTTEAGAASGKWTAAAVLSVGANNTP